MPARAKQGSAVLIGLVALAVFINYVDRGNLATAGPLIIGELRLSNTAFGVLISAFFWTYVPAQLVAGWMAQRYNTYLVMAGGLAVWALATALTGLVTGFAMLLALRLLLGLGESIAFPCASKLVAERLSLDQLGKANGMMSLGVALGPGFGIFVGGLLMAHYGWRMTFILFGLVSLLWLIPWLVLERGTLASESTTRDTSSSYFAIMKRREAWGTGLGHFCSNYTSYFILAWLPLYLVRIHGLSMSQMAVYGGIGTVVAAASAVVFGWASDHWIRSGASINDVRKPMIVLGFLINAITMLVCAVAGPTLAISALIFAAMFHGLSACNVYAIAQTLAGPNAAGKWVGFQNFIANFAGILAPVITGVIVDRTGQFYLAFALAGTVSLFGMLGYGVLIRRVEPLDWGDTTDKRFAPIF